MSVTDAARRRIRSEVEAITGRHDDPSLYGGPPGDPGLCGPDSVSWRVNGDLPSVLFAGTAAIVLEILHPSVVAGVEDHSAYKIDPLGRARSTLGYVLGTTFGHTDAAEDLIARVRRIHGHIQGVRPDGVPYRALDPELLAWVHTCIPWMVMTTYQRLRGPLSRADQDAYLREQAEIGRRSGDGVRVPTSVAELDDFVAAMRPRLAFTEQTRTFLDVVTRPVHVPGRRAPGAIATALNDHGFRVGMRLAPRWAGDLVGVRPAGAVGERVGLRHLRNQAALVRWAYGTPPHLALARERARPAAVPA